MFDPASPDGQRGFPIFAFVIYTVFRLFPNFRGYPDPDFSTQCSLVCFIDVPGPRPNGMLLILIQNLG